MWSSGNSSGSSSSSQVAFVHTHIRAAVRNSGISLICRPVTSADAAGTVDDQFQREVVMWRMGGGW